MNQPLVRPFGGLKAATALVLAATAINENVTRPYAPDNVLVLGPTEDQPDNVIPEHILRDLCDYNVEGFEGKPVIWFRGEGEQSKPTSLFAAIPQNILFSYGTLMSSDAQNVMEALEGGDATTPNATVEIWGTCIDEMASANTKQARDGRLVVFDWRQQMARNQQNKDDADKRTEYELVDRIGVGWVPGERDNTTVTHPKQNRMKAVLHSVGIALSAGKLARPEGLDDEAWEAFKDANRAYWREHWAHTTVSQAVQNLGDPESGGQSTVDAVTQAVVEAATEAPKVDEQELSVV